jgi:hypothetical protein
MLRSESISQSARTEAMFDNLIELLLGVSLAVLIIGLAGVLFDYFNKR